MNKKLILAGVLAMASCANEEVAQHATPDRPTEPGAPTVQQCSADAPPTTEIVVRHDSAEIEKVYAAALRHAAGDWAATAANQTGYVVNDQAWNIVATHAYVEKAELTFRLVGTVQAAREELVKRTHDPVAQRPLTAQGDNAAAVADTLAQACAQEAVQMHPELGVDFAGYLVGEANDVGMVGNFPFRTHVFEQTCSIVASTKPSCLQATHHPASGCVYATKTAKQDVHRFVHCTVENQVWRCEDQPQEAVSGVDATAPAVQEILNAPVQSNP